MNERALVSKLNRLFEQGMKLSHKKKVPGYKNVADLLNRQFEVPAVRTEISNVNVESVTTLTETVDRCSVIHSIPSEHAECTETTMDSSEAGQVDITNDTIEKICENKNTESPFSFDAICEESLLQYFSFHVPKKKKLTEV